MHTDGQNRLKKTRNRNLHFLAWHRIPTCDLLVCREPKIEKCYFIKMSDLWRLIPTPLMYIFTKRFGRGEVELGTVLKRSKLHEKHNQSLKNPDICTSQSIFSKQPQCMVIFLSFVLKLHVCLALPMGGRKWPNQSLFLISLNPLSEQLKVTN